MTRRTLHPHLRFHLHLPLHRPIPQFSGFACQEPLYHHAAKHIMTAHPHTQQSAETSMNDSKCEMLTHSCLYMHSHEHTTTTEQLISTKRDKSHLYVQVFEASWILPLEFVVASWIPLPLPELSGPQSACCTHAVDCLHSYLIFLERFCVKLITHITNSIVQDLQQQSSSSRHDETSLHLARMVAIVL